MTGIVESSWLAFRSIKPNKRIKTEIWSVTTLGAAPVVLGWIKWYSQWRKYVYEGIPGTILDSDCLRDIANFCTTKTQERKRGPEREENGLQDSEDDWMGA